MSEPDSAATPAPAGRSGALEGQGATSINSGQPGLPGLPGQRRAHSGGVFTRTKLVSTSINPNHQQLVNRLVGMPHQSLSQAQQQSQQQQQKYNITISDSGQNQNQNQKHQVLVHQPLVNQYHQSHQHRTTNLVNKVNTNLLTSSSSSGVLSSTIRTHSGGANVFVSPSVNSGLSRKTKTMSMSNVSDVVSNVTVTGGVDNIGVGITDGRSLKRTLSSTEFMNSDSSSSGTYSTGTTSSDVMSGVANKRLKMSDGTVQDTSPPTLGEIVTIVNEEFTTLIKEIREKYNQELLELYHLTTIGHMMDMTQLIKAPKNHIHYYTQYINARQIMPPDEDIDLKVDGTISQTEIKPQLQVQQSNSQAPEKSHHSLPQGAEIKIPGVGVTPVAVSTTLPAAVAQLNQQGGTPLVPEHSNRISISSNSPDRRLSNATLTSSINKSSTASSTPAAGSQEQIVEKAKQEAYVMQRITELQREGLWTEKRLPKQQEPPRLRVHWDYLLEEMVWLATDYAQERKWKKKAAKTCAKMVQKYFQDKAIQAQKAEKAEELHRKKLAAWVSKEIKIFWSNVQKLVEYKQKTRLDETKRRALNQHLSFIVDQTEMYSKLLAEGMNKSSTETPRASDDEFVPNEYSDDDETTIDREEAEMEKHDKTVVIDEVAALQRESELELEDVLNTLPNDYFTNRNETESDSEAEASDSDKDFDASDKDSEDIEDTIDAEERAEQREGKEDSGQEINMLKAESEMDIEELRKKYSRPLSSGPSSPPPFKKQHLDESDDEDDEEIFTDNELSESESEKDVSMNEDIDLKSLLPTDENISKGSQSQLEEDDDSLMNNVAALAESIQPRGNTLSSTNVVTPVPFLLKHTLREYQHIGLDWLVTMFDRKLNGILADEMGLGKTIQTIALLAHLACAKENWGPHLIIVPTSVMLNWEMEIKKWCPGFKILTYYGNQKERKMKRTGWTKPNAFHICITSYKLVIQDHQSFRRKKWKYLILDEAQNIKNFKSQRWQMLLNFQTQQRLLLTGTPLQNNLMELWSLMHFLMPHVFQSHREFKEWFSNPVSGMIEGNSEYNESIIKRLHKVLRPFLLRRLKCEVEKQMPRKFEHVIMCRLSKRQRYLYDDYMDRAKTKETLDSGNLLSVINVLMQLRKVCNHPNLFEVRQTISPFQMESLQYTVPSMVYGMLEYNPFEHIDLFSLNLLLSMTEVFVSALMAHRLKKVFTPKKLIEEIDSSPAPKPEVPRSDSVFYLRWEDPNMLQKRNLGVTVGTSPAMKIDLPPIEGMFL